MTDNWKTAFIVGGILSALGITFGIAEHVINTNAANNSNTNNTNNNNLNNPSNHPPAAAIVTTGSQLAVGDKIWASGQDSIIFENVNPGTISPYHIPDGHYAGQVLDVSPAAYVKVQLFSGAPVWDNANQYIFYLSKADGFKKG